MQAWLGVPCEGSLNESASPLLGVTLGPLTPPQKATSPRTTQQHGQS